MRLTLHYDGSGFYGWQLQPGVRTVQGEIEAGLAQLCGARVAVIAAGRTDRGVHATGQVASADVPGKWQPADLQRALNAILPDDIWIQAVAETAADFHARYSACARGYVYRVGTRPEARSPFLRRWCWPLGRALAPNLLAAAAQEFVGTHSFRAFAKAGQPERGELCTVQRAEWRSWGDVGYSYHVVANRFLHHMVRYMVGTMIEVARERRPLSDIARLLRNEPGVETSPPAPPEGLFLQRIYYDPHELDTEDTDEIFPG